MTRPACVDLCPLYCRRPSVLMHGLQLFLVNPLSTILRQLQSFFFLALMWHHDEEFAIILSFFSAEGIYKAHLYLQKKNGS